jgi:hypothetical protein
MTDGCANHVLNSQLDYHPSNNQCAAPLLIMAATMHCRPWFLQMADNSYANFVNGKHQILYVCHRFVNE